MPDTIQGSSCPHCGKPLQRVVVEMGGKEYRTDCFVPCDCAEAMRERTDAEARRHREAQEEARRVLVSKSGIPKRYASATDPDAARVADAVESGRNAYITGGSGVGKTFLACAAGLELIARGKRVKFASMLGILDEIKAGFRDETDPLPAYKRAPILILDDLGKGAQTDFALERLFALIDYRSAEMKPTIVTTQYMPSELISRLASGKGDVETANAIVSRLREDCLPVKLGGSDRRNR